ncbi:MAG: SDR family NAD(P)-dependent oxidoreductase, partial [Alcanivoracaceae bacterium]|nr:SDR family NAD(P)-dependent oxidoreductase [Alcanivoracaceae bacterium]
MAVQLDGAVVAITGAGRGIGMAIARRLAAAGARVSIGDIDAALAEQAAAAVNGFGCALDVRNRA